MTQRFAIGGLVTAFAVQARAVHGLSDARVGACFSILLVVFAAAVFALGRKRTGPALTRMAAGRERVRFGAAFAALAFAPRPFLPVALAAAGLGAALVYAPCLDLVSAASPGGRRATSMALLHSAGAVGMILGPISAALLELALRGWSAPQRCAAFMAVAGAGPRRRRHRPLHAAAARSRQLRHQPPQQRTSKEHECHPSPSAASAFSNATRSCSEAAVASLEASFALRRAARQRARESLLYATLRRAPRDARHVPVDWPIRRASSIDALSLVVRSREEARRDRAVAGEARKAAHRVGRGSRSTTRSSAGSCSRRWPTSPARRGRADVESAWKAAYAWVAENDERNRRRGEEHGRCTSDCGTETADPEGAWREPRGGGAEEARVRPRSPGGRAAKQFAQMVDTAPINIMFCDRDLTIRFMNPTSRKTLSGLEEYLPVQADEVVGSSVDIFHKNPAHQRRLLGDPRNLPHHRDDPGRPGDALAPRQSRCTTRAAATSGRCSPGRS